MNIKKIALFCLILLAIFTGYLHFQKGELPVSKTTAAQTDSAESQELIFLLQYIGRDYQYAVAEDSIINAFEYQEMMTFCHRVIELYLTCQPDAAAQSTLFQLQELREMVHEKVDKEAISSITKTLVQDIAAALKLKTFPEKTPDLAQGKQLYIASGCATCHGTDGSGDSPLAASLNPGPGNFTDIAGMNEATPYQFYNVIRLGVIGTSMPSFQEAFSKQEAWAIAFYLMTLRSDFKPIATDHQSAINLADLATKSNIDIQEMITTEQLSPSSSVKETTLSNTIDYLRKHPNLAK